MSIPHLIKHIILLNIVLLAGACHVFAQQDPIPDTLDWRQYYPLEIGNAWEWVDYNFPITGEEYVADCDVRAWAPGVYFAVIANEKEKLTTESFIVR